MTRKYMNGRAERINGQVEWHFHKEWKSNDKYYELSVVPMGWGGELVVLDCK